MKPNENTERLHDMTQLIKRMSAFLLCLMLLMGAFTETALAAPDWPSGVSVQAESGIVIDADTGTVLWGQNIHNQYFPASITKIMTALIVIEKCSLDETVTFSHNAVFNVEAGSSNAGINEGDKLSVKDCLYALLLKSANESANALAEHVAGSTEAFADMMNAKAKELGCTDTHFANPSGLNNPEHYTSTYDMALIARAAFLNPTFEEIDSTTYYKLPPNSINPEGLTIYPGHKMLKKSTPYYYPGIVGGKTGYTTLAGNTLVTCAKKNGLKLIAVILKGSTPQYWTDTKNLLDFGFQNFVSVRAADHETKYSPVSSDLTFGGLTLDKPAALILDPDGRIILPKTAEFSDAEATLSYDISDSDPDTVTMNARSAVPIWRPTRHCLKAPRPPIRFQPPSRKANPRQEPGKLWMAPDKLRMAPVRVLPVRRTPAPRQKRPHPIQPAAERTAEPPHRHQTEPVLRRE